MTDASAASQPELHIWSRNTVRRSVVFDTYWRFATERQQIFHRRASGLQPPWTSDPVLAGHRFTNAYRASDRVSQYLINVVIPGSYSDPHDVFFRILLFKIFNRIGTWVSLEREVGQIHAETYDALQYGEAMARRLATGERLYSAAYIMPIPRVNDSVRYKHEAHLHLLASLLKDQVPDRIANANSLAAVYRILLDCQSFGPFLAFQYAIDLNYSPLISFDETDFVVAGPGAKSGIEKCFQDIGGWSYADIIRWTAELAPQEFQRLGLEFKDLWGRQLQLIDCQNLFCEVDKYARVTHPGLAARSGRSRIKQSYTPNLSPLTYVYPAKWGVEPTVGPKLTQAIRLG